MGLGRFEVRFFSWDKFTKMDLALTLVIKNHSKVGYTRSMMFSRIWLNNFLLVKSRMGTPLDWKFLTLKKKSHFHLLLGQTRARKKSCSELDTRYLIPNCFSPWSFLTHIENPMGLEGFLWMESLFVGQKKVLCMASCSFGTLTDIPLGFRLSQSPIDTIPPGGFGGAEPPQGVDPLPSW